MTSIPQQEKVTVMSSLEFGIEKNGVYEFAGLSMIMCGSVVCRVGDIYGFVVNSRIFFDDGPNF